MAAGQGPLLREVERSGGAHRWARELRLDPPPARKRGYWTDERIRETLTGLVGRRSTWPSRRELAALGLDGMHRAMNRRGRSVWEAEFSFSARVGDAGVRRWTPAAVRTELSAFCAGRATYPSHAEFQVAGLDGLFQAIRARHGGHARWASEFGLRRQAQATAGPSGARWTEARVEHALRALIDGLGGGRYPTEREFRAAGQGGLWRHIKANQGHACWAVRLGVERPTAPRLSAGA